MRGNVSHRDSAGRHIQTVKENLLNLRKEGSGVRLRPVISV